MTIRTCLTGLLPLLLLGCAGKQPAIKEGSAASLMGWTPPPAGTIVAADSMPFGDHNEINHYFFSVRLRAAEANTSASIPEMTYDVLAGYGPAQSQSRIMMPRGGADLKPLLRADDSEKYGFIIGFIPGRDHGGDTAFQPYYKVVASRGEISIKAVKGYVFE